MNQALLVVCGLLLRIDKIDRPVRRFCKLEDFYDDSIYCCLSFSRFSIGISSGQDFNLKNGDRVLFYGDSITNQRLYTRDVEIFALTRYPDRKIAFFNSGVGGDTVTGGVRGTIDQRLKRDLFPYNPSVITIMLGMNDGRYHPSDAGVELTYEAGYGYILDQIKKQVPSAKIVLIQPSPYDDVTRVPMFEGGYNDVLLHMSSFLARTAQTRSLGLVNFNTIVNDTLRRANSNDPGLAQALIVDRVHPGPEVHWLMADALLKGFQASPVVTRVKLSATNNVADEQVNTTVKSLKRQKGRMSWAQEDKALPLPLPIAIDPAMSLVAKSSSLVEDLDQETLEVDGLSSGSYTLSIDGQTIDRFSNDSLQRGINLALEQTPMMKQAEIVAHDVELRQDLESLRFSQIIRDSTPETKSAISSLEKGIAALYERSSADAQPVSHRYELIPAD